MSALLAFAERHSGWVLLAAIGAFLLVDQIQANYFRVKALQAVHRSQPPTLPE